MGRHGAGADGDALLRSEGAGQGQYRNDHAEAAEPNGDAEHGVVERRVGRQPGKGTAVVVGSRGEGVEDFREPVRAGVGDAGDAGRDHDGDSCTRQHQQRRH